MTTKQILMSTIVLEYEGEPIYPYERVTLSSVAYEYFKIYLAVASQLRTITPYCLDKPYKLSRRQQQHCSKIVHTYTAIQENRMRQGLEAIRDLPAVPDPEGRVGLAARLIATNILKLVDKEATP